MNPVLRTLGRRLRLGVVGGGPGSFIGPVHRIAARLDDRFEITAAALSSDPATTREAAVDLGIAPDRAYADWRKLVERERQREDGIEALAIMTPNHLHAPVAYAALDAGFDVICDKPLALTFAEAAALAKKVEASGLVFVGDADQLPSVGAGDVLAALLESGVVPQVRLTEIFRQAWQSRIVVEAHRVLRGEAPRADGDLDHSDFFLVPARDPARAAQLIPAGPLT